MAGSGYNRDRPDEPDAVDSAPEMGKAEYLMVGGLLVIVGLAFPAYRDVQILQSFAVALCAGLGIPWPGN